MSKQVKTTSIDREIAVLAVETNWLQGIEQLESKIKNHKGNIDELCSLFNGFNLEKDYFDFNYGIGVYTVGLENNQLYLKDVVDIYNHDGWPLVEGLSFNEVKEIIMRFGKDYMCPICSNEENSVVANYCKICGIKIER